MSPVRDVHRASLPWDDPSVDALDPPRRAHIAGYWAARAQAELNVARAFSELRLGLAETGAAAEVIELLQISIENEHDHADLCLRLACRYAAIDVAAPVMPSDTDFPRLPSVPAELRPTLHAIGLCCINESIATVWLEHAFAHASAPLVRAATRLHVSDEVLHARVGWAHLASSAVGSAAKKEISRWIVPLLRANVGQWLAIASSESTADLPGLGLPPAPEHRRLVLGVVENVILPGLARFGIEVAKDLAI
jgi:hypothetical protein